SRPDGRLEACPTDGQMAGWKPAPRTRSSLPLLPASVLLQDLLRSRQNAFPFDLLLQLPELLGRWRLEAAGFHGHLDLFQLLLGDRSHFGVVILGREFHHALHAHEPVRLVPDVLPRGRADPDRRFTARTGLDQAARNNE